MIPATSFFVLGPLELEIRPLRIALDPSRRIGERLLVDEVVDPRVEHLVDVDGRGAIEVAPHRCEVVVYGSDGENLGRTTLKGHRSDGPTVRAPRPAPPGAVAPPPPPAP